MDAQSRPVPADASWYLPDCDDKRVAGILTFKANDSATLELIGDIDAHDNPLQAILEQKPHSVIWGVNSNAQKIHYYR